MNLSNLIILKEPLQKYHYDYYLSVISQYIYTKYKLREGISKFFIRLWLKLFSQYSSIIPGFTIIGIYTKWNFLILDADIKYSHL